MIKEINDYLKLGRILFLNKGLPNYLVFHITSFCNARCKMCFAWKNLNLPGEQLSLGEIDKISKSLNRLAYVSLGGGEPFLRKDISDIAYIFYKNNEARIFQIATNSLQPEQTYQQCKKILEQCPGAVLKITLSLDGLYQDHDEIRGVSGIFEKVLENYNLLNDLRKEHPNFEIQINTVYSSFTVGKEKKIYDWVKNNLNVDMHGFTYVRGNPKDPLAKNVSIDAYASLIKYIEEDYRQKGFRSGVFKKIFPVLSLFTRRHLLRELRGQERLFKCPAGKKLLHLNSFGEIFPCEYLPGMSLGNVRDFDYDVKKILATKKAKNTNQFIKDKKCSCTWECAIKQSIVYDWKKWPSLLKEILKLK